MEKNSDRSSAAREPHTTSTTRSGPSSVQGMEDLQSLVEELRQLKATNENLRELLRERSQVSDPGQGPSTAPVNVAPVDSVANDATNPRYLYVPRERKCSKFTGKMSVDLLTVEQWVEEVRRCLGVRHMSIAEQLLFITDHLEGGAKSEVNFHPSSNRDTPEKIFAILTENYSCSQSYVAAQLQFFQRTQLEGESLRDFSHALKSLMDAVICKTPGGIPNADMLLRDQFIEHVLDDMLRRELKQRVLQEPNVTFVDLRGAALRWAEASRQGGRGRPRAFSCDSYSQAVDSFTANSCAVTARPNEEIAEIKECLRKQQSQLDAIMEHVTGQCSQLTRTDAASKSTKRFRFQADGRPICHRCNRPGHIARFCRANLMAPKAHVEAVTEAKLHSQVVGGDLDSQPSEN